MIPGFALRAFSPEWINEGRESILSPNPLPTVRPFNLGRAPGSARCSARLTHIALARKPYGFAYWGSRNVVGSRPLAEIVFPLGFEFNAANIVLAAYNEYSSPIVDSITIMLYIKVCHIQ